MVFASAGYDGTVDEKQFASILNRYAIVGPDDFKASAVAGADRTLSISDGNALGPGAFDAGSAFSPVQFDAVTSGTTRWDLVVLRRDWQPPGGNTSIAIVKGGTSQVLPTRNQTPGVIDDQPLYLQQVTSGSTSLGTRVDLRVWQGPGGAEAADKLALTYLASPGAAVKVGTELHRYELQGNGVWGWRSYGGDTGLINLPSLPQGFVPYGSPSSPNNGWTGVQFRILNGWAMLNGAVTHPTSWGNNAVVAVIPSAQGPATQIQGQGCVVRRSASGGSWDVAIPAGSGAYSFSAMWPVL